MFKLFTLRAKIISLFLCLGPLPILVFSTILFYSYSDILKQKTDSLLNYAMSQTANNISHKSELPKDIFTSILLDSEMSSIFFRYCIYKEDNISLRYQLQNHLSTFIINKSDINSIVFISRSTEHIVYTKRYFLLASQNIWNNKNLHNKILDAMNYKESPHNICDMYVFSSNEFFETFNSSSPSLYFAFPIYDLVTKTIYGTVVIEISNTVFSDMINLKNTDAIFDMADETQSYIVNEQGVVVSSLNHEWIGCHIKTLPLHKNSGFTIRTYPIQNTTLTLYSFLDRTTLLEEVVQFQRIMLPLPIITAILFIGIILLISKRYTDNIRYVAMGLHRFLNVDQDVKIEIDSSDEIYVIVRQFNHMQKRIQSLVSELKEKNIHIQKNTDQRRRAEIHALQMQINPHFLYNTLDSINWKAIRNHQNEISDMLSALAKLLRYSISNIDIVVTLQAELLWLEKYVYLQSKRFSDSFKLEQDIRGGNETLSFPVHKMLLHPIVENSILHGFEKGPQPIEHKIRLTAEVMEDGRLKLELSDNGKGIDAETLKGINDRVSNRQQFPESDNIGLKNISERLYLYYGSSSEFSIKSTEGVGTKITLIIPYCNDSW